LSEDGLDHDGLDNDMARVGLVAPILQFWDRPSPTARRPIRPCGSYERHAASFVVQCEQFKTAKLLLDRLRAYPNVEVLFDHEVIDVSQTSHAVTVQVRGPSDVASHSGGYLIGADGGRSTVRRRSGIKFEGFTWPERFIVLTTPYDFEAERGYCYRRYFADPGAWCNCFKVSADGPPGLWRTVYPTDPAQGEQDILSDAGVQARMQSIAKALRDRASQSLCDASAGRRDVSQRLCAPCRRRGACQQSDRRHGIKRRHSGRR
jgi:3-(3-hydroxy-phenyl)propionate hydroxylase